MNAPLLFDALRRRPFALSEPARWIEDGYRPERAAASPTTSNTNNHKQESA